MLAIVPTPIGNLKDITYRAIEVLTDAELIFAEDTRVTKKLLNHYDIETPLQSLHIHNEHRKVPELVKRIGSGGAYALVTDAGTPGISDPGYLLIKACLENGIEIMALPGPTAFVPALVASGFPCDRFHFEGFLPKKKGRQTRIKFLTSYPHSIIIYESPFRIKKTLEQVLEFMPGRLVCVARELTKLHEEVVRGSCEEVLAYVENDMTVKGEFVLIVGPV